MKNLECLAKDVICKAGDMAFWATSMVPAAARQKLEEFSPRPIGMCKTVNTISLQYDAQIIIPAYNAEKYIQQCLDSVFAQVSDYRILVSIVNDGSTDGTNNAIQEAVKKHKNDGRVQNIAVELITQENRGLSGARNTALQHIKGNYVTFVDSDDVLTEDAIKTMLDNAYLHDADILQGGWYTFIEEERTNYIPPEGGKMEDCDKVLSGYPWGKLYKYSMLADFQFPEGFLYEDTPLSFIIAVLSCRCFAIKDIVYGYRQNPNGITATSKKSTRAVESYWITEECLKEFPLFGVPYDQRAYEYLLRQSLMNAGRARLQPREIRKAEFVLTSELMGTYFAGFHTQEPKMKKIEQALRNRQFTKFEMLRMGQ
ncbi:MAG: glycosyltransferase family A protein [Clostridia bacterium]|nr:glycosyltransferase family A protein [Clostridia bacterium]